MTEINISATDEYKRLVPFFMENKLEYTEADAEEVPAELVKCWKATDREGRIMGGFVLAVREGEYICDGIAVDASMRGTGLGGRLLAKGLEEVRSLGGKRLYLVARAPGFFRKKGFETITREEAPDFFECFTCPQFNVTCRPEVMRIILG